MQLSKIMSAKKTGVKRQHTEKHTRGTARMVRARSEQTTHKF